MAGRISQDVLQALIDGAPGARVTQIPLEALVDGAPNALVTQEILEAILTAHPNIHISQITIEALGLSIEVEMPQIYPTLPGLTFPVGWATDFFSTETQEAADGSEFDVGLADEPLHTFTLEYEFLDDRVRTFGVNEQRLLRGFFGAHRGNLVRFLFWLKEDHQVRSQLIGTTDGANRIFDLTRTYGVGEASWTEAVGYVDQNMPFNVYLDDVLQSPSSYTLDPTVPVRQQIIFVDIPTAGQVVRVDMDYFYYCKFADREMSLDKFMDALWSGSGIKLRSCRPRA